jgi:hypothetical protein
MIVTVMRRSMRYVHANEKPPQREQLTVTVPDDHVCNMDTQTRVLRIVNKGGTPIFAINDVDYFFTDAAEVKRRKVSA